MNKKTLYILIVLVIAIALAGFVYYQVKIKSPKVENNPQVSRQPIYELNGTVQEVRQNSVLITTGLTASNGSQRTIEFSVTDQTKLTNSIVKITAAQVKSGKPYHPQTIFQPGKISDLKPGMNVIKITSKDDLLLADKTNAVEIEYVTYDNPTLQSR